MASRILILCGVFLFVGSALAAKVIDSHSKPSTIVQADDPCIRWWNCSVCLEAKFCGWCSTKVIYQDGSQGYQCAGFSPDNGTNPFVCVGTYSTDKCAVGYNCSGEKKQCVLTNPGDGMPLEQCTTSCFPKTYTCSPINASCIETDTQHGGIPLDVCTAQCKPQNNTPSNLVGTWRGLEINGGYLKGEWKLNVTATNATLFNPSEEVVWKGDVSSIENYVIITISSGRDVGKKIYALAQVYQGPVTRYLTIAASKPGEKPPGGFDEAMTSPVAQEFVFAACLNAAYCNFDVKAALLARKIRADPPKDECSPHPNCTDCLDHPFCGWCSTDVIYRGNILGTNCAGFNTNSTNNPFVCVGTYSTTQCPKPAPVYECNATSKQCFLSKTGAPATVCNATCGKNHTDIKYRCNVAELRCEADPNGQDNATCEETCKIQPFPVALEGVYRGIQVSKGYASGEWKLVIEANTTSTSAFSLTDPQNITVYGQLEHIASEAVLRLHFTRPVAASKYALYELAYGPETNLLTLATSAADSQSYPSFIDAMTGPGMSEFNFLKCLNPQICKFA